MLLTEGGAAVLLQYAASVGWPAHLLCHKAPTPAHGSGNATAATQHTTPLHVRHRPAAVHSRVHRGNHARLAPLQSVKRCSWQQCLKAALKSASELMHALLSYRVCCSWQQCLPIHGRVSHRMPRQLCLAACDHTLLSASKKSDLRTCSRWSLICGPTSRTTMMTSCTMRGAGVEGGGWEAEGAGQPLREGCLPYAHHP